MGKERKVKGRISRIGSYAIASSITNDPCSISCTTFNILAPIYKRLGNSEVWLLNLPQCGRILVGDLCFTFYGFVLISFLSFVGEAG